ncbi:MAG: hypothetical protein HYV95_17675 [Opitutae bacterium]|nr:hypothetical protein [Opitutae bacterium]
MSPKFLIPVAALLLVTAGCGKKTSQKTSAGGVTMEQKGDVATVEVKGKDGGPGMKIVASEKGVPLPENFPKDVPVIKDALVIAASTLGEIFQVKTNFKGSIQEGLKFYAEKLKGEGWDVTVALDQGDSGVVSAKKDKRECAVMFSKEDDKLSTALIMTTVPGK